MLARAKLWTNTDGTLNVTVAGLPGQKRLETGSNLQVALDLSHLVGFTVIDTQWSALIQSGSAESGTSVISYQFGIGVKPTGLDLGDYGNLELYEGDWFVYHAGSFRLPGVAATPVLPSEASYVRGRSRSGRRVTDVGQNVMLVIQQDTAVNVNYTFNVQHLVMMP